MARQLRPARQREHRCSVQPDGWSRQFAAPQRDLFWFDCGAAGCSLVSVTAGGQPRFTVPIGFPHLGGTFAQPVPSAVAQDVVMVGFGNVIEGRSTADGALVFHTVLPGRDCGNLNELPAVTSLAADGAGHVLVAGMNTGGWTGCRLEESFFLIDVATGDIAWSRFVQATTSWPSPVPTAISDARGRLYGSWLSTALSVNGGEALAFELDGGTRWRTPNGTHLALTAVIGDRVYQSHTNPITAFDTETGVERSVTRFMNWSFPKPLASDAGLAVLGVDYPTLMLQHWSGGTWSKVPLHDFFGNAPWMSNPVLSNQGTMLFADTGALPATFRHSLYEIAFDGSELARCPVTVPNAYVARNAALVVLPGVVVTTDSLRHTVRAWRWRQSSAHRGGLR